MEPPPPARAHATDSMDVAANKRNTLVKIMTRCIGDRFFMAHSSPVETIYFKVKGSLPFVCRARDAETLVEIRQWIGFCLTIQESFPPATDRVGSGMTHGHACRMIHHALCYTLTNLAPDDNIRLLLLS